MLCLLMVIGYLLSGVVAMSIAAIIHLVTAEKKGYEAIEFWYIKGAPVAFDYCKENKHSVIFGLIIWPVRLVQFYMDTKEYYELYNLKY